MSKYDWIHEKSRWKRLLLRLLRTDNVFTSSEDDHCFVTCVCGEEFSVGSSFVRWCPKCGRGYSTEFKCYRYPARLVK